MAEGAPAIGRTAPQVPLKDIASFEGVVPKTTDWRTLGTTELERSLFVGAPSRAGGGVAPRRPGGSHPPFTGEGWGGGTFTHAARPALPHQGEGAE